jgi:hypothetical protein
MPAIKFSDIKTYLDAIAANTGLDIDTAPPHFRFWNITYNDFITGSVPHVLCKGNPIPIIDRAQPLQSPFFTILIDPAGFCGKPQMPGGGPFITEAGYQLLLPDGTAITGQQIQDNISSWLSNGFPEN